MDLSKAVAGKFLKSRDIEEPVKWTVRDVTQEEMEDGLIKPVLWFEEDDRGLVLNKTNANVLIEYLGKETSKFRGAEIVVFVADTEYQGKATKGLRVRRPKNAVTAEEAKAAAVANANEPDDIPF